MPIVRTVLYYYIPEGVQKTNKGDAENEFHLWKLSLYVIYCPACVRAVLLLYTYNNADDSARTHICLCTYLAPRVEMRRISSNASAPESSSPSFNATAVAGKCKILYYIIVS